MFVLKVKAQNSNFLWAKQMGGTSDDVGGSIAVDANGNVYTVGNFRGTVDFDPGPNVFNLTASDDLNVYKVFVSKLDASGNFVWAKVIGYSGYYSYSTSIKLDGSTNIYISGCFWNTTDFDPGPEVYNLTSNGLSDIFICKLNDSGNFIWAKAMGGSSYDYSSSIALDGNGNVYTTGSFRGTADFDPGPATYNLTSSGYQDEVYICKLKVSGNFVWAKQLVGINSSGIARSIAVDANENVYSVGYFYGTIDFDPGDNTFNLTSDVNAIFISKLDVLGNYVWAKKIGGTTTNVSASVAVDGKGNVYTTGTFTGTADFDPGPGIYNLTSRGDGVKGDAIISKLDSAGNFLWAKQLGGTDSDGGVCIKLDIEGNAYTVGSFNGTADFDPGPGIDNLVSAGQVDIFVSKLDISGDFIWAKQMGGSSNDAGIGLAVDANKNVYLTGYFSATADFDPGSRVYNMTAAGDYDIFVVKFGDESPATFRTPQITLSKSIIQPNQTLTVSGQSFTPNGALSLNFYGAGGLYNISTTANSQGSFTYNYSIPSNAQNGIASIKAYDSVSGNYASPVKSFEIRLTASTAPISYLNITYPEESTTFSVGQQIVLVLSDKLQRQYASYFYPMQGATGKRKYRYRIEYQLGSGGTWQSANPIEGSGALNFTVNLYQTLSIKAPTNNCRIRVVDDYVPGIVKTTPVFSVVPAASNLKAELVWDNSFPQPNITPQGVAADGVARLYVRVTKLNPGSGPVLQRVNITAKDGVNKSVAMLGKLLEATDINSYSTQANSASSIAASSSIWQSGNFWFWYVAPDDFSQSDISSYANLGERTVQLHIVAQFDDNSKDSVDLPVKIVRPPLVMAHGLASSEAVWYRFHYSYNNTDYPFTISPLFKVKNAINLYPHYSYSVNALQLLSPNGSGATTSSNRLNSFQGNIDELRKAGYAANQVDYVCHSMGGCVLRTAMSVYEDEFYGKGGHANDPYKSYGKGFVHKAITINTPHNNSPVADAVAEFIPQAPWYINLSLKTYYGMKNEPFYSDFIQPNNKTFFDLGWQATDAVRDLQVNNDAGGKDLAEVTVKNHLIAGDVDIYDPATAQDLADLEPYLNVLDKVLDIMEKITLPPAKDYLQSLQKLNKVARVLPFIEWYSKQKGFPNFLGDGDLIVPLSSQLAGVNVGSTTTSIFNNTGFLNAFHTVILNRTDVGNKVKLLLNSSLSSNLFADKFPATKSNGSSLRSLKKSVSPSIVTNDSVGKTKVEITRPSRGDVLFADSTINIQYKLKDTVGLAYVDINFQSETNKSFSRSESQILSTQVDPNFIGNQLIFVTAVYETDSTTYHYTDTLTINVQTQATLLDFKTEPKVTDAKKGEEFYPQYKAIYSTSIAALPNNNPDISVSIGDPSIIKYNSSNNSFTANTDTGSTFIIFNYKGFTDTIFVYLNTPGNLNINAICPNSNTSFFAGTNDNSKTYQWQVDAGGGFENIGNNSVYSGATTNTLTLTNPPTSWYGYRYRCVVSSGVVETTGEQSTLFFAAKWSGSANSVWENAANWACNSLPDENTDVIIPIGLTNNPILSSNAAVRSVQISNGSTFKVNNGYHLMIKGVLDSNTLH